MNHLSEENIFSYISITILFFLTSLYLTSPLLAELPPIQMPEYIIEGIEKATQIKGDRIPNEITYEITIPDEPAHQRPNLDIEPIQICINRPTLLLTLGTGYLIANAGIGGFNLGELGCDFAMRKNESELIVEFGARSIPKRTTPGAKFQSDVRIGFTSYISESETYRKGLFEAHSNLFRKNYNRYISAGVIEHISLNTFNISLIATPLSTKFGTFAGQIAFQPWKYEDCAFTQTELSLQHSLKTTIGRFESKLFIGGEMARQDIKVLQLTSLDISLHRQFNERLFYTLGGAIWVGTTPLQRQIYDLLGNSSINEESQLRQGFKPCLGLIWLPPFGGIVSSSYKPKTLLKPLYTELTETPFYITTTRGTVIEDLYLWSIKYEKSLISNLNFDFTFNWQDQLHTQYPYYTSDERILLTLRRSEIKELKLNIDATPFNFMGLSLWTALYKANTKGCIAGNNAPLVPNFLAGLESTARWRRWILYNSIVWEDEAPLKFEGDTKMPSRLIWDSQLKFNINPKIETTLKAYNILNKHYYTLPHYDANPTTIALMAQYRFW